MGFFYQAIKRATGQTVEPPEAVVQEAADVVAKEPLRDDRAAGLRAPAPVEEPRFEEPRTLQSYEVQHPLTNLVAFLTPPVLEPNIAAMEQCRTVRSRLRELMLNRRLKTLLVTSALPEEGKTLMSVNMAYALSQIDNTKVLLIDADMRRPSVGSFLKMKVSRGLDTFLRKGDSFEEVCWSVTPSLDVIPTHEVGEGSAELLHGQRMQQLLAHVRDRYTFVILDAPPLFPIVDAQVLSSISDSVLLVVRADRTPFDLAMQAADMVRPKLIGTVLNGVENSRNSTYYGGYYGTYGYLGKAPGKGSKKKSR